MAALPANVLEDRSEIPRHSDQHKQQHQKHTTILATSETLTNRDTSLAADPNSKNSAECNHKTGSIQQNYSESAGAAGYISGSSLKASKSRQQDPFTTEESDEQMGQGQPGAAASKLKEKVNNCYFQYHKDKRVGEGLRP